MKWMSASTKRQCDRALRTGLVGASPTLGPRLEDPLGRALDVCARGRGAALMGWAWGGRAAPDGAVAAEARDVGAAAADLPGVAAPAFIPPRSPPRMEGVRGAARREGEGQPRTRPRSWRRSSHICHSAPQPSNLAGASLSLSAHLH
jgi:hypothetical protein